MTRKRAAIYTRVSKDRVGAGLGVERQRQDCQEFSNKHDLDVVEVYVDNDISAYTGKKRRPAYEKMLNDIQAGRIDVVVTWHADRLHRAPVELERYINICDPAKVPTHTVRAGELDLSTASGRMVARMHGAASRHESEQKAERVARQKQQAIADGKFLGGRRPFGYAPDGYVARPTVAQLAPMFVRSAELHGHSMPTDDEQFELAKRYTAEADAIVDATRRVLAGEALRSIARLWNDAGLTTSTGRRFTSLNVRAILLRPRNAGYTGTVRGGEAGKLNVPRIVGEAKWPALVDKADWEALRAKLLDQGRTAPVSWSRKLVGSYLYKCGNCGGPLVSAGSIRGKVRYKCQQNLHLTRVAEPLDEHVIDLVGAWLRREGARARTAMPDLAPLHAKIDRLRAREGEVASLFADPEAGMSAAQFKIMNERIQAQLREARAELGTLTADDAVAAILAESDPEAAFRSGSIEVRRAIIDGILTVTVERVGRGRAPNGAYFNPESIKIEWKVPAAKRVKATRD